MKKAGLTTKASGSNLSVNRSASRLGLVSIMESRTNIAADKEPSKSRLNLLQSEESSISPDTPPALEVPGPSVQGSTASNISKKKKQSLIRKPSQKWNELAKRRSQKDFLLDESTLMERSSTWGTRRKALFSIFESATRPTYIKYYIDALPKFQTENGKEEEQEESLEREYLENCIDGHNNKTPLALPYALGFEESSIVTPPPLPHSADQMDLSQGSFFLKRKSIISMRKASFAA
jgi:hypothetical protein